MLRTGNILRVLLSAEKLPVAATQVAGLKYFGPPISYDHVEFPERTRLKFMDKVPTYPPNIKPPKMQKRLRYMRGPELVHNTLVHKQYGIIALSGGRLSWAHLEMMRLAIIRKIDPVRMFAIWRVDSPWQPLTKKGQGQRMGGGKGAIDHYVTPIKAGRVLVEVGGTCEYAEVEYILKTLAKKLPFKAMAVSQEIMDQMKAKEEKEEKYNLNPWTFKYIVQNNLGGCNRWISPVDRKWFGKYH